MYVLTPCQERRSYIKREGSQSNLISDGLEIDVFKPITFKEGWHWGYDIIKVIPGLLDRCSET